MSYFGNELGDVFGDASGLSLGCPFGGSCSRNKFNASQFNNFGSSSLYPSLMQFMPANTFSPTRTCGPNGCSLRNNFY
jgi:hypothetical protein